MFIMIIVVFFCFSMKSVCIPCFVSISRCACVSELHVHGIVYIFVRSEFEVAITSPSFVALLQIAKCIA